MVEVAKDTQGRASDEVWGKVLNKNRQVAADFKARIATSS